MALVATIAALRSRPFQGAEGARPPGALGLDANADGAEPTAATGRLAPATPSSQRSNADGAPRSAPHRSQPMGAARSALEQLLADPQADVGAVHALAAACVVDVLEAESAPSVPLPAGAFAPADLRVPGQALIFRQGSGENRAYLADHGRFPGFAAVEALYTRRRRSDPGAGSGSWRDDPGTVAALRRLADAADAAPRVSDS